ncbi:MAG: peptidoglycan binding domain-containing protein, partial [Anaerolineae bacterium]|nr:peptidoglycan binding domain-containing protein [Anaerolineae bacterium]
MDTLADTHPTYITKTPSRLYLSASALLTGVSAFFIIVIGILLAWNIYYAGRIFPGVSVAGVDLSNMRPDEAAVLLEQKIDFAAVSQITFKDGDQIWSFSPEQLGMYFDPQANAQAAREVGRRSWPWTRLSEQYQALHSGFDLAPHFIFDGPSSQAALTGISQQINQARVEGSLSIRGFDVQAQQGQIGRSLDIWATTGMLAGQLVWLQGGEIPLVIHEFPPEILNVAPQAEIAERLLTESLIVRDPDSGEVVLDLARNQLGELLEVVRHQEAGVWQYRLQLNPGGMAALLSPLSNDLSHNAENARYIFNDETRQLDLIESAIVGRSLQVQGSIDHINQQLASGAHIV